MLMSLLSAAYLVNFTPFESRKQNFMEIFNEIIVLIGSYHMVLLTQLDPVDHFEDPMRVPNFDD